MSRNNEFNYFAGLGLFDNLKNSLRNASEAAEKGAANATVKVAEAKKALEQAKESAKNLKLGPEQWEKLDALERKFQLTLDRMDSFKIATGKGAKLSKLADLGFVLAIFALIGSVSILLIIIKIRERRKKKAEKAAEEAALIEEYTEYEDEEEPFEEESEIEEKAARY